LYLKKQKQSHTPPTTTARQNKKEIFLHGELLQALGDAGLARFERSELRYKIAESIQHYDVAVAARMSRALLVL
jgi:hypothetical protein